MLWHTRLYTPEPASALCEVLPDPWCTKVTPQPEQLKPFFAFVQQNVLEHTNNQQGLTTKDYDFATSARPEQIRDLFGQRRTLAIGAAFGVVTVLGPRSAGQIEVATFRCDGTYLDGRHP